MCSCSGADTQPCEDVLPLLLVQKPQGLKIVALVETRQIPDLLIRNLHRPLESYVAPTTGLRVWRPQQISERRITKTDAGLTGRSYVLLPCKKHDVTCEEVAHILVGLPRSCPESRLTERMEGMQLHRLAGAECTCGSGLDEPNRFVEGVVPAPSSSGATVRRLDHDLRHLKSPFVPPASRSSSVAAPTEISVGSVASPNTSSAASSCTERPYVWGRAVRRLCVVLTTSGWELLVWVVVSRCSGVLICALKPSRSNPA
jgi:hypothetical protein